MKTGASALTPEERGIKGLIEEGKVRFILKREEVEITTPEEKQSGREESEELKSEEIWEKGFKCNQGTPQRKRN